MQSVLAEAKATLSETQLHPTSSLSVWALFPSAGLDRYLPQWRRTQAPPQHSLHAVATCSLAIALP